LLKLGQLTGQQLPGQDFPIISCSGCQEALTTRPESVSRDLQKAIVAKVGDYQIRRCEREDVRAVIEINMETLPEHYSDYFYYEILAEFPETFLVAEVDESIVGYVMCRIEYGFSHLKRLGLARKGHVVSIAVKEEHRGKGVGTMLMRASQEAMVEKTATESYLEVRVTNVEAIALYQRLGYSVSSRVEAYYKDGEAALVMATKIGQ
jgi:ribosomal-protein-alanine N-acetyltransferase